MPFEKSVTAGLEKLFPSNCQVPRVEEPRVMLAQNPACAGSGGVGRLGCYNMLKDALKHVEVFNFSTIVNRCILVFGNHSKSSALVAPMRRWQLETWTLVQDGDHFGATDFGTSAVGRGGSTLDTFSFGATAVITSLVLP